MDGKQEAVSIAIDDELQTEATVSEIEGFEREGDLLSFFSQHENMDNYDASCEESSTSSNETDTDHGGQLGLSLRSLPGNLVSSIQQNHYEQLELLEKKWNDSQKENRALSAELGKKKFINKREEREHKSRQITLELARKSQSTEYRGIINPQSSIANEWELTGAKPKANTTVVRLPSQERNVLDNMPWQPTVKGIKSGEGPSAGLSLHRTSYGDHLGAVRESHKWKPYEVRDLKTSSSHYVDGTLGCVLPPPEQGGRQTKDHGLQQPQETQVSLQPEYIGINYISGDVKEMKVVRRGPSAANILPFNNFSARHPQDKGCSISPPLEFGGLQTTIAGLPQEACGIDFQFLMRHSEDQSFLGRATTPGSAPPKGRYVWTSPHIAVPRGPSAAKTAKESNLMALHRDNKRCSILPAWKLGGAQTKMAHLPQETVGIQSEFLVRHSADQSLPECGSAQVGAISECQRGPTPPPPEGREQKEGGMSVPLNRPSEQEEIEGFLPLRLERDRVTRRWCSCNRIGNQANMGPICELCVRNHYCGPGSLPHMNNHHICCYCLEDGVGEFLSLPCNHKLHKDCMSAAIRFNMLNCPICGQAFMRLA